MVFDFVRIYNIKYKVGDVQMYDVLRFVHDNIDERLFSADVASRFGYSQWHFCVLFRQFTGKSFVEYVRYFRMQHAALDVMRGERVTDIAMKYGYDSVGGFNKSFLAEFGCSPREFKTKSEQYHIDYSKRRSGMKKLSDRCAMLREEMLHTRSNKSLIEFQWNIWAAVAAKELTGRVDSHVFTAAGIVKTADCCTPFIGENELIVGYNFGPEDYPHFDFESERLPGLLDRAGLSARQKKAVLGLQGKPNAEIVRGQHPMVSKETQMLLDEHVAIGFCLDSNHSVIGYEKLLRLGYEGLLGEIEVLEKQNENPALYAAMKDICRAGCRFGVRYAQEARRMAALPDTPETRAHELLEIAFVCERVPRFAARTLREAIQSLWFGHIFNTWEDTINANSLGRLDQILYPYYMRDIERGVLTEDEAFELICCLWIKLYRDYDVQQSCVGGCKPDGTDAVNKLSYMMLDATEQLDFIRCLSVRYSPETDRAFLKRALEVVGHVGKGVPFFFNDAVMIPALVSAGISLEDARNYTQIGCVETVIPGKSNPHAVTGQVNILKALEFVLTNGHSMIKPEYAAGLKTGGLSSFETYDKLVLAVKEQIRYIIETACKSVCDYTMESETNAGRPYKSLLTEGCAERGKGFNQHGAIYDYYQVMIAGIPNLADSLAVLKQFVYKTKKYTLDMIVKELRGNFPNEDIRNEFINKAPKYGNDIDEVDKIAVDMVDFCCDVLEEMSEKLGIKFHAQPFTFLWMLDYGMGTGATPDGRRSGEVIAYSVSPMQGRDFNGFIALLNSISKLPTKRTPGTTSAIVEVDPKLFTDSNIDCFTDILLSAAERGLMNIQFNTIDAETLADAKKHPEKYNNLAVRVSGFSQKFNLLDERLQNHIIERTKHQCL